MTIPVRDLQTFHAVARAGSMAHAANELGVTAGAISQRIKALEDIYGMRLFTRSRKGVTLTKAGQALWDELRDAFRTIETAHAARSGTTRSSTIRITAAPTYAHSSLVRYLGAFQAAHPNIRLSVETGDHLADLRSEPLDLAIRHGLGVYQGLKSVWLCSPELIMVASPELLERHGPIEAPGDCLKFTLLHDSTGRDWPIWFQAQGVDDRNARFGPAFNDDFLTVRAAVEGQGLALLNDVYVEDELASGRLVRVLEASWPTKFAYYAVGLSETLQRPAVARLVQWLQPGADGRLSEGTD